MPSDGAGARPWGAKEKQLPPGTTYGEHAHPVVSLTLTLSGGYEEVFEDRHHACRLLALQLKPRAVPHTTRADRGAHLFIVHVPQLVFARCSAPLRARPRLWAPGVASAIALGCAVSARAPGASAARIEQRLRALLATMERGAMGPTSATPPWIVAVERRLDAELVAPPRLGELARDAGVHPVHLARSFRRTFGRSVGEWIRRARADRAVRALASTDADVASIALTLGYYDQSLLGRDLRRETGWSPVRFRAAVRALGPPGFRSS